MLRTFGSTTTSKYMLQTWLSMNLPSDR